MNELFKASIAIQKILLDNLGDSESNVYKNLRKLNQDINSMIEVYLVREKVENSNESK